MTNAVKKNIVYVVLTVVYCFVFVPNVNSQWIVEDDGCRTPDRGFGTCIPLKQCKPIIDFIDAYPSPIPLEIKQRLQQYVCGMDGRSTKVCCPPNPINVAPTESNVPPDVSGHRNLNLLPLTCGRYDSQNRIVHGEKAGLYEFPWMALISYRSSNGNIGFKCGATIINEKYILTAAHCISNYNLKQIDSTIAGVRLGEYNINSERDCEVLRNVTTCSPPYQDFFIEKVIPHPSFNPSVNNNNDIGLLRLSRRINFNLENMKPVCLPLGESRNYEFGTEKGIVTGWGTTETGRSSPELLKVNLEIVSLDECRDLYKKRRINSPITNKQFCAGGKNNKDSCAGDSGGPLHALYYEEEFKYVQQGIVSFGPRNCGAKEFPGVYTKLAYYMDWILDTLEP